MALNVSGRAKLVEAALGHAWKNVNDRVNPILLIPHCEGDDLDAKGEEGAVQKPIHEKELA